MHILDRRLNPDRKSLENRQRFLRRAKAQVQEAVRNASASRDMSEALEQAEISIPADGVREPQFHTRPGPVSAVCWRIMMGSRPSSCRSLKPGAACESAPPI